MFSPIKEQFGVDVYKGNAKGTEWSFVTLAVLFNKDSERMLSKGK